MFKKAWLPNQLGGRGLAEKLNPAYDNKRQSAEGPVLEGFPKVELRGASFASLSALGTNSLCGNHDHGMGLGNAPASKPINVCWLQDGRFLGLGLANKIGRIPGKSALTLKTEAHLFLCFPLSLKPKQLPPDSNHFFKPMGF